jgi:hypothetical protein
MNLFWVIVIGLGSSDSSVVLETYSRQERVFGLLINIDSDFHRFPNDDWRSGNVWSLIVIEIRCHDCKQLLLTSSYVLNERFRLRHFIKK